MKRKEMAPPPNEHVQGYLVLEDGRTLAPDDEVTIIGAGRYKFKYGWNGDTATYWGPVGGKRQNWRTFRRDQIKTVHRKKQEHGR